MIFPFPHSVNMLNQVTPIIVMKDHPHNLQNQNFVLSNSIPVHMANLATSNIKNNLSHIIQESDGNTNSSVNYKKIIPYIPYGVTQILIPQANYNNNVTNSFTNSAFKLHSNRIDYKKFNPKILINPYIKKNIEESENINKDKIFTIEKIRKNDGSSSISNSIKEFNSPNSCSYYSKFRKNEPGLRLKRKDKYKMFNSKFKEECIKMVIIIK